MDPPAQQQNEAERAALREEAQAHLFQMAQTTRLFNRFCNDMQVAVNELSQHDVTRYLYVTVKCDCLKDWMTAATNQSGMFLHREVHREQVRPHRTRDHMRRVMEQVLELRCHRNRISQIYLKWMICDIPRPRELEASLVVHMSLLQADVQRILNITTDELQAGDDQAAEHVSDASQPGAQQG